MSITYDDIVAARERIAPVLAPTPCPASMALSQLTGCNIWCKLDFLQPTGSFKERGVANALQMLTPDQQRRGVVAASAGNHALAMAYHGRRLGIPVTVVMPRNAPLIKVARCRSFGAAVECVGETFGQARQRADELVQEREATYLHGFDDPHVIAGQGTMALEVLEQVSALDAILVPVGGGGLIAGVAVAMKHDRPDVQVIGVEPARSAGYTAALAAGGPVAIDTRPTLADGLAVGRVGDLAYTTSCPCVDRVVQVDERELALAILRLMEMEKAVVEGAAAAPLAALLGDHLEELRGKNVVLPLCGGNIDPLTLRRVIEHGLAADGRLHRLQVHVSDRPGGLAAFATAMADAGVSIQDIRHDRIFAGPDVAQVRVVAVVETRDRAHLDEAIAHLQRRGIDFELAPDGSPS